MVAIVCLAHYVPPEFLRAALIFWRHFQLTHKSSILTNVFDLLETFFKTTKKEIDDLKQAGATGFVIGCLNTDFSIDYDSTSKLINHIGKSFQITFHRAFDIAEIGTLESALIGLDKLGCDWLLTSGREKSVTLGKSTLLEIEKIITSSKLNLKLLCGGGVNQSFIESCLRDDCLTSFHGSFSAQVHCKNDIFDLGPKFETDKNRLLSVLALQ